MRRRAFVQGGLSAALSACSAARPQGRGAGGLGPVRDEYEALMTEHGLHQWTRYAGAATRDEPREASRLRARERDVVLRAARAAATDPDVEPRERDTWARAAAGLALLDDDESVRLADRLEKTINEFAFEVEGKRVGRAQLRGLARSADEGERRAQRRAMGALHAEAAPLARALLRRRRALGRRGRGFHAELLALRGVDARWLATALEGLTRATSTAFSRALADGRARASLAAVRPWDVDLVTRHLGDPVDEAFPAAGAMPMARAAFSALGVDLERPKVRVDVRDFAFAGQTISVRVPDDVRTVLTPTPGPRFYATLLHELGHAFAATRNRERLATWKAYEWVPGMTSPGYEEGVAEIFARALDEDDGVARLVPALSPEARASFLRARARTELFSLRQRLASIELERRALDDPDGDLDALSRTLDRELLGLDVPDDAPPVWATSPFLATYPVYVQSYVLAALVSAQVRASLRARLSGPWLSPTGGALLAELVADGARATTDEKMVRATGAPLGADAYLAELLSRV